MAEAVTPFWRSFWITLILLVAFVAAAFLTPETAVGRAEHMRAAAAWQHRQDEKDRRDGYRVPKPLPAATVSWAASGWARGLDNWDRKTFQQINLGWDNRFFDRVMPIATALGDGKTQAVFLFLLLGWSWRAGRNRWKRSAILGVVGLILSVFAPQIKIIVPRWRPPSMLPYDIVLLVHPLYGGSFPSGHTMSSFAIATVLAMRHRWTAPPAFALAAIIGLSRISVGVHWPLDVLGGAIIGVALGTATVKWDNRKTRTTE